MPIQIGAKPDSSFDDPLGLLSDCHRRIEKFLAQLIRITEQARGGPLTESLTEPMATALRYFARAAPLHTQDEEASLFPRLRDTRSPDATGALDALDRLEADHRVADASHAEVDALGNQWLRAGSLSTDEADRLLTVLRSLQALYARHIEVEDTAVFPLAGRLLEERDLATVGREMATRRGLDPDNLPGISHCRVRNRSGERSQPA
jgi:hemerythrin-like domain-containing protein